MGLFDKMFEKKYCDICGEKIGLLGNRKLEDGNLCKNCAAKLSPWFSERRTSTVAQIKDQLAYREENRNAVAAFNTTRTIGKNWRLLLDEGNRKFIVTSVRSLSDGNPDVLDFSQATGCNLDIKENRTELKRKDSEGKQVSYNPPRYEYSYNFFATIFVNHPWFDEIRYMLNSGAVKTGEHRMNAGSGTSWTMHYDSFSLREQGLREYDEYIRLGEEVRQAVEQMRTGADTMQAQTGSQAGTPYAAQAAPQAGMSYEAPQAAPQSATGSYESQVAYGQPSGQPAYGEPAPINNGSQSAAGAVQMQTIRCPWCGKTVETAGGECPYCGGPL